MAKKKKAAAIPPMEYLKKLGNKFPGAWDAMAKAHAKGVASGGWPSWCYVPVGYAMEYAVETYPKEYQGIDGLIQGSADGQAIAALAAWRANKEVFTIDADFAAELFGGEDDLDIPGEVLLRLPYPAFYIDLSNLGLVHGAGSALGTFVYLEYDRNSGNRELRFFVLYTDGTTAPYYLHIDEGSVSESIKLGIAQSEENMEVFGDSDESLKFRAAWHDFAPKHMTELQRVIVPMVELVLYLCSANAEFEENETQKAITKRNEVIHDRQTEVRKWDVGVRIGAAVRSNQNTSSSGGAKPGVSHSSPRPHMRRAHWHHFWTGPKSDASQRKLVLRWVPPTPVGVLSGEESPAVIHEV